MPTSFDAIVIGTGQSGPSLAVRLAKSGKRVAVIERGRFGGTCVNTGCIPTKAMVASARVAYLARRAGDFGVVVSGEVTVDMPKIMARKASISAASQKSVEQMLVSAENCTVFRGHGRFVSNYEITVARQTLQAEQLFINVGGRASVPKMPGLDSIPFLTNSSLLEINFLPRKLIIIGGSYIALEFAQMFRRFGSEVVVIERGPRLVGHEDEDVSDGVKQILENEGVEVVVGAHEVSFAPSGNEIKVSTSVPGNSAIHGTHVLLATGREPNTDDLGLETTDIRQDDKGFIQVNEYLKTSVPGVWAIGDCNARGAFTHTSYNDYEIVAANLFDNDDRNVTDRIPAYCIYIDPPLGRVGLTEKEVRDSGKKALIGTRQMSKVGRATEKGETQGFMKILVDAESKQILGANILGTDGDEAIHCILDVMYCKAPYTVLQRAVHIHPTVSELIPTLLGSLEPLC